MKRILLLSLTALLIIFAFPYSALAGLTVRVGLVWQLAGETYLGFEAVQGTYSLKVDGKFRHTVKPGTAYRTGSGPWGMVLFEDGKPLGFVQNIQFEPLNGKLPVFKVYSSKGKRTYRGSLEITRLPDGNLRVVNTLGEEEYLYGVVPIEMSNAWAVKGLESLKAQAVAARTYLHGHYDSSQKKGYNITDSPNVDQAYAGYGAEGAASKAVDATKGEVLVDSTTNNLISALYHSHSGGHTEDSENVWGGKDLHLRGKPDPFSFGQGFLGDSWSYTASAIALGRPLGLGPIVEVKLEKFPSGRVKTVKLRDVYGKTATKTGRQFVGLYYPRGRGITSKDFLGNLFTVEILRSGLNTSILPDPLNLLTAEQRDKGPRLSKLDTSVTPPKRVSSPYPVYRFTGSGWGHGVGMSQWGAYGMAKQGYTYGEILKYYYSHVSIIKK